MRILIALSLLFGSAAASAATCGATDIPDRRIELNNSTYTAFLKDRRQFQFTSSPMGAEWALFGADFTDDCRDPNKAYRSDLRMHNNLLLSAEFVPTSDGRQIFVIRGTTVSPSGRYAKVQSAEVNIELSASNEVLSFQVIQLGTGRVILAAKGSEIVSLQRD